MKKATSLAVTLALFVSLLLAKPRDKQRVTTLWIDFEIVK